MAESEGSSAAREEESQDEGVGADEGGTNGSEGTLGKETSLQEARMEMMNPKAMKRERSRGRGCCRSTPRQDRESIVGCANRIRKGRDIAHTIALAASVLLLLWDSIRLPGFNATVMQDEAAEEAMKTPAKASSWIKAPEKPRVAAVKARTGGKAAASQRTPPVPRRTLDFQHVPGADYHDVLQSMVDAASSKKRMQAFHLGRSRGQGEVAALAYRVYHGAMQVGSSLRQGIAIYNDMAEHARWEPIAPLTIASVRDTCCTWGRYF